MPRVESNHGGGFIIFGKGRGPEGELVQVDWDFPATAQSLGWSLRRVQADAEGKNVRHLKCRPRFGFGCDHGETDGTVDCPCGVTASDFIRAAAEYLESRS